MKNRRGFTLMEMIVVIAIIVFLASVTMTGVSQYTKRAREMKASVNAHSDTLKAQDSIVDGYLTTTRMTTAQSTTNQSVQVDNPTAPATEPETEPEVTTVPPTEATQATQSQTEATPSQTEATVPPTEATTPPVSGGQGDPKGTKPVAGTKVEVSNSWGNGNNCQANMQFDAGKKCAKIVLYIPNGVTLSNCNASNCTQSQQGNYLTIVYTNSPYWDARGQSAQFQASGKLKDFSKIAVVYIEENF